MFIENEVSYLPNLDSVYSDGVNYKIVDIVEKVWCKRISELYKSDTNALIKFGNAIKLIARDFNNMDKSALQDFKNQRYLSTFITGCFKNDLFREVSEQNKNIKDDLWGFTGVCRLGVLGIMNKDFSEVDRYRILRMYVFGLLGLYFRFATVELKRNIYYGYPNNNFFKFVGELFDIEPDILPNRTIEMIAPMVEVLSEYNREGNSGLNDFYDKMIKSIEDIFNRPDLDDESSIICHSIRDYLLREYSRNGSVPEGCPYHCNNVLYSVIILLSDRSFNMRSKFSRPTSKEKANDVVLNYIYSSKYYGTTPNYFDSAIESIIKYVDNPYLANIMKKKGILYMPFSDELEHGTIGAQYIGKINSIRELYLNRIYMVIVGINK